ncbi:hypothetical protein RM863_29295 [Streptomyces sp. DSM 41014]|uniref:Uncharacterized protein n=1 Tax=Streptomyces hintoniae TaxID=3075521 RepID=A0ABU2USH5_9ACTN|nr:hypothetical protein [Streptomyces sp. DSM 41014]MDT0476228.1 hypothetical protein [Streptomyces sp. DSM 41014]
MGEAEGGPDMVSFRELARRLVAAGIVDTISHQRVSKIANSDPKFPPVTKVGTSNVVDYRLAEPYFRNRVTRPGWRTDIKGKRAEQQKGEAQDG